MAATVERILEDALAPTDDARLLLAERLVESVNASEYPPGEASILLKVDDSESRWNVRLPDGISASSKRVAIALSE